MSKKNKREWITFWHCSERVILDVENIFQTNVDGAQLATKQHYSLNIAEKKEKSLE